MDEDNLIPPVRSITVNADADRGTTVFTFGFDQDVDFWSAAKRGSDTKEAVDARPEYQDRGDS